MKTKKIFIMTTKKIILTIGLITTLFGCGQKKLLTDAEKDICVTISFDESIAESIKQETKGSIGLLPEVSEYGEILKTKDSGLCSIADEQIVYKYVFREKENFRTKGYLLFLFEDDENKKYIA